MTINDNAFGDNAVWITCPEQKNPLLGGSPATYFRKSFFIKSDSIPSSTITIAALGLYAVFINGKKANTDVLPAPFTNYNKTILYHTYDITEFLRRGKNIFEIVVGDGWCNQNAPEAWGFFQASWKTTNQTICSIHIGDETIVSDESWNVCQDGPIYRSALRLGEFQDNNLVSTYSLPAKKCMPPRGTLHADTMHKIRECQKIKPKSAIDADCGILLDFGQNIAGYIGFCINGHAGQIVTITYGDKLTNNRIDNDSNSQYISDEALRKYFQIDKITLKDGKNEFKPLFVYHGFRYAFIEGLSMQDAKKITAFAVRTAFPVTGKFISSSLILNRLQKMCLASTEANFVGIPTDCPHREKNGWTGDLHLSVEQMLYNYDCAADLEKYLDDICDCQLENGCIPCIAPTAENCFGYDWGNGPAWDLALFEIPYRLAIQKNDWKTVKKHLRNLEKYYAYLQTMQNGDGLYEFGLGDWNAPKTLPQNITPLSLVASLCVLQMTRIMKYFYMELFGSDNGYSKKETALATAIRCKFIHPNGSVANDSVCALAGILYFDLAKDDEKPLIFAKLLTVLREADYTMQFGILGNKYVYRVLCENGRSDIALKILTNKKYPSFGYWIKQNAVTLWEDFEGTNSRNHYMFSDISAIFYQYFAGISYTFKHGVQHNIVRLFNQPRLKYIYSETLTPNGVFQIEKRHTNSKTEYALTLPSDSITDVIFPDGNTKKFISNEIPTNIKIEI